MSCNSFIVLVVATLAPVAWASVSACTSPTALSNFQPPDVASGCAYVDNSFTNFAVNAVAGEGGNTGNASTVTIVSNPTVGDSLTSTSGQGVADFASSAWTSSNGTSQAVTFLQYAVQANTGDTIGGYTYTNGVNGYVTPAAQPWALSSITLDLSGAAVTTTGNAGTSFLVLSLAFCLNDTTLSMTGSCNFDGGADAGHIYVDEESNGTGGIIFVTYECVAPGQIASNCNTSAWTVSPDGLVITYNIPGGGVQSLSVAENINLSSVPVTDNGGGSITLNNLLNEFGDESTVPEPSSTILFALGMVALALLAVRAKMRAS